MSPHHKSGFFTMEKWWLTDDVDLCDPGRSPDEIFGNLPSDHLSESVSELSLGGFDDLDKLLNSYSSFAPLVATFDDDDVINSPPLSNQSDISDGMTSPDKDDFCLLDNQGSFGVNPSPHLDKSVPVPDSGCSVPSVSSPDTASSVDFDKALPTITKSQFNTAEDILTSLIAESSPAMPKAVNHLVSVLDLSKSANYSDSPFTPSPPAGYVTPPWSPESTALINKSTQMLNGDEIEKPRSLSEGCLNIYYCQYCGREFKHKIGLKNHERSHLRGETHMCGYCGKKFRYKNKLRRHVNVHARELRICRFCGQVQSNDYELVQHEKQHKKDGEKVSDMKSLPCNSLKCLDNLFSTDKENSTKVPQFSNQPWSSLRMAFLRTQPYPKPMRLNSV